MESGPIENGYKTVWDFATNVANGEIASLARTDVRCGNDICLPHLDTILAGKNVADSDSTYDQSGLLYDYEEGHPLEGYYYDVRGNGTKWKQKIALNSINATSELGYDGAPVPSDLVNIKDIPIDNIGGLHYDNRTKIAYSINMGNTLYKYDKSTDGHAPGKEERGKGVRFLQSRETPARTSLRQDMSERAFLHQEGVVDSR